MPLLQIPFRGGIDEKTDPKQAEPGTLLVLQNARQQKNGEVRKRNGLTSLPFRAYNPADNADFDLIETSKVMSYKDEILVASKDALYSFSEAQQKWVYKDELSSCVATREGVQQFSQEWTDPDVASAGGYEFWIWRTGNQLSTGQGDIYCTIRDQSTGVSVLSNVQLTAGLVASNCRLTVCNGYVVLTFTRPSLNALYMRSWQIGVSRQWTSEVFLASGLANQGGFNVYDVTPLTFYVAISYLTNLYRVGLYDPATAVSVAQYNISGVSPGACYAMGNVTDTAGNVSTLAYETQSGSGVPQLLQYTFSASGTLLRLATLFTASNYIANRIGMCADPATLTGFYAAVSVFAPSDITGSERVYYASATSGVTDVGIIPAGSGLIYSRPFVINGVVHALALIFAGRTFVLAKFNRGPGKTASTVATIAPRIAFGLRSGSDSFSLLRQVPCHIVTAADGTVFVAGTVISDANASARVGLQKFKFNFDDAHLARGARNPIAKNQYVEFGDSLFISSGTLQAYDGVRVAEASYICPPAEPILTPIASGGAMLPGDYVYRCYWEVTDVRGQIHRSALSASVPVTTTNAGNTNSVRLEILPLAMTRRQTPAVPLPKVALVVCRTTVNGNAGVLYKQTVSNTPVVNQNNTEAYRLTVVDTASDNIGLPLAYTTGGVLENFCPPSLLGVTKHRRRLVGIGEDLRTIWFSTEYVDREAPGWSDLLTISFDEDLVALATMDDKLIVFSRSAVWVLYGDGPNPLGQSSDWSSPQRIQASVGCYSPQSVVTFPNGVAFQSANGLYLVSRDLRVSPLGLNILDTLSRFPVIVSATQIEGQDLVIWECQSVSGTTGCGIVYDYLNNTWSVDVRNPFGAINTPMRSACMHNGVYYTFSSSYFRYKETSNSFLDAGSFVPMALETAWISPSGPHAFQRIRKVQLLGERVTPHGIKVSAQVNHLPGFAQSYTWQDTENVATSNKVEMRLGATLARCVAVRVRLEDVAPVSLALGNGAAGRWSGICFDVVPKEGARRFGAIAKT